MTTVKERFEDKIYYSIDGCWYWTGCLNYKGYGQFFFNRTVTAHRVSYEIYIGQIGDFHVLHRCDNRACVNPDHLFLGTCLDNVIDKIKKGRAANVQGINHPRSQFTESQIREIRQLRGTTSARLIAAKYGVSRSSIEGIFYSNWKHI